MLLKSSAINGGLLQILSFAAVPCCVDQKVIYRETDAFFLVVQTTISDFFGTNPWSLP